MAGFLPLLPNADAIHLYSPLAYMRLRTKCLEWQANGTLDLGVKAFFLLGALPEEHR